MQALQAHLLAHAQPGFALPPKRATLPDIRWADLVSDAFATPATTLPNGVMIPVTDARVGGPIRNRLAAIPANPTLNGYPCLAISRPYVCRGTTQSVGSRTPLRIRTDAPVIEFTGVVPDGGGALPVMIVNGELVSPTALSGSRGASSWTAGTLVVDFHTREMRDIWIETVTWLAYIRIDAADTLLAANDSSEPQMTVIGDSYLQTVTPTFPFDGAIAQEIGARLGIRKVATDAVGGSGYYNTSNGLGNLNHRLPAHSADESIVYLVMAGLNDYYDSPGWPTRAAYESSVYDYLQNLRAAQPKALIVVTASFCPLPPYSDTLWIANAATNTSGLGDYPYKSRLHKDAIRQIAGPWAYIDVLMGGGWLNSSGKTGDITGLQWLTGGSSASQGAIGGGGGFGGIKQIPILSGGKYSRGPAIRATGGSGQGLLMSGVINSSGALTAVSIHSMGYGYEAMLPKITVDSAYEVTPAVLGTPVLTQGFNGGGGAANYPATGPAGADLNNIYRYLWEDKTHPSVAGGEYLGRRLAENIYQAVMAL